MIRLRRALGEEHDHLMWLLLVVVTSRFSSLVLFVVAAGLPASGCGAGRQRGH
jgi:hypothetical protein